MPKIPPKRILLTGAAARGLGRAMVAEFIEKGHTILGCGRSAADIENLQRQYGSPHQFKVVDVAEDEQVRRWAEELLGSGEAPDLLLNNAAVVNSNAPLWEVTHAEFLQVVMVNVIGVANVVRHFVPAMLKRRRGVVVNFSSGWGRSTSPEVAPYCATKWAIEGLTRALAEELPGGMAAIPLNPGIINTEMLRSCFGEAAATYPDPDEWATRAVPFLLKLGPRDNGEPLTVPS